MRSPHLMEHIMSDRPSKHIGVVGMYDNPGDIIRAAEAVRGRGP